MKLKFRAVMHQKQEILNWRAGHQYIYKTSRKERYVCTRMLTSKDSGEHALNAGSARKRLKKEGQEVEVKLTPSTALFLNHKHKGISNSFSSLIGFQAAS